MTSRKNYPRSVFRDLYDFPYSKQSRYSLYQSCKGSEDWVQRLKLLHKLPIHSGCVNCICWNERGDRLLSGSDDQNLILTNPFTYKVITQYKTSHRANIFSAKFLPGSNDNCMVSCSGDGAILHTDLTRVEETHDNIFTCHTGTVYEVVTIPYDQNVFMSCGEDYSVRSFDLRIRSKCSKLKCTEDVVVMCQRAVTALSVNNCFPYQIAIGCADSTVRLYDRRMLGGTGEHLRATDAFIVPGLEKKSFRITSLCFSPESGEQLLVSYSSEHLYLFNLTERNLSSRLWVGDDEEEEDDEVCDLDDWCSCKGEEPLVRRLRLRGDWSDTGPDARPHSATPSTSGGRPVVQGGLIQRMTDVLSRMLNDPATRAALSQGGEDTLSEPDLPSSDNTPLGESVDEESGAGDAREGEDNSSPEEGVSPSVGHPPITQQMSAPTRLESFSEPGPSQSMHPMDVEPTPGPSSSVSHPDLSPLAQRSQVAEPQPSTSNERSNLVHLRDEFSTMFQGFKEKYGKKPMVNLVYSAQGSTASTISMSVDEQTNNSSPPQSNEEEPPTESSVMPAEESAEEEVRPEPEPSPQFLPSTSSRYPSRLEKEIYKALRVGSGYSNSHLVRVKKAQVKNKYTGHRNARTMIKEATFWGSEYVMSGSDCGHVFIWCRWTGRLVMTLEADHHVVNCLQPHPTLPLLATSGIDYDVKLWAPLAPDPVFDLAAAEELTSRNAIMLEETKDTITVPASFMIRMLACLNQLRRAGGRNLRRRRDPNT